MMTDAFSVFFALFQRAENRTLAGVNRGKTDALGRGGLGQMAIAPNLRHCDRRGLCDEVVCKKSHGSLSYPGRESPVGEQSERHRVLYPAERSTVSAMADTSAILRDRLNAPNLGPRVDVGGLLATSPDRRLTQNLGRNRLGHPHLIGLHRQYPRRIAPDRHMHLGFARGRKVFGRQANDPHT